MPTSTSKRQGKLWPQILAAMAVNLGAFVTGSILCWPKVALPQLRNDASLPKFTEDQLSWIAASTPIGAVLASFPAGFAVDTIGSRATMFTVTIPVVVGWLLVYFGNSFTMLFGGQVIASLCYGVYRLGGSIYISEIAEARIRGSLVTTFDLMISMGILAISVVGAFVSLRALSLVCAALPIIFHLVFWPVPESPRFLVSKGRSEAASRSLMRLRRLPLEAVQPEVDKLRESMKICPTSTGNLSKYKQLLKAPVLKSLGKCLGLRLLQVLTGVGPISAYAIDVFESAATGINAYVANIMCTSVQVIAAFISITYVDRLGRRTVLIFSAALICLSNAALATFFSFADDSDEIYMFKWLPLVGVTGVLAGYSMGLGPIPNSILSELLPQQIQGVGSSLIRIFRAIISFLVTLYFKDFISVFGPGSAYWAFSGFCVVGIAFVWLAIPETRGRSLEDIQKSLYQKKSIDGALSPPPASN